MYNSKNHHAAELPSSQRLLRSTLWAAGIAFVLLFTVILPAEYAVDPTGIGRALGLTRMGEIKQQNAQENQRHGGFQMLPADTEVTPVPPKLTAEPEQTPVSPTETWRDEIRITLKPDEGKELKLVMKGGDITRFRWDAEPGSVNFDMHGDGANNASVSYEKGFFMPNQVGELKADFDGRHGWFWRNRNKVTVEVVLRLDGDYQEIKRYF